MARVLLLGVGPRDLLAPSCSRQGSTRPRRRFLPSAAPRHRIGTGGAGPFFVFQYPPGEGCAVGDGSLRIQLLGPVQLLVADRPVPIGGPAVRGLLALLALEPNRIVALDDLSSLLTDCHGLR